MPSLDDHSPSAALDPADLLIDQFVLAPSATDVPNGWPTQTVGDWELGSHPRLPVVSLTASGTPIGWLLGYAIDESGLLPNDVTVEVPAEACTSPAAAARFVDRFGGRFAALLVGTSTPAVHLDPAGSMSVVYAPHRRTVASTMSLIPDDNESPSRAELNEALGIPDRNAMYPLGLTPRHGIDRLLPNHHLDLERWTVERDWPSEPLTENLDTTSAVTDVADVVRHQIEAVVAATPTYLYLTAGRDSRMLVACARAVAQRLETLTIGIDDDDARIDAEVAGRIAERFGLKHRSVPIVPSTDTELAVWSFRTGSSTGEVRGRAATATYAGLAPGHASLGGNVGEIARGFYWRPDDGPTTDITVNRLLTACHCPIDHEPARERVERWLDTVPTVDSLQVLDLFYIEQRLGGWAGVWPYAQVDSGFLLFPLSHRRAIEAMLRLPAAYRRDGRLPEDVIAQTWPELGELPFNEPIGLRLAPVRARRVARSVKRRVRQIKR